MIPITAGPDGPFVFRSVALSALSAAQRTRGGDGTRPGATPGADAAH